MVKVSTQKPFPAPASTRAGGAEGPAAARERGRPEIMDAASVFPLESRAGGSCREWIHYLHQGPGEPLDDAGEPMRRIYCIYQKEGRADRLVSRLVALEREARVEFIVERSEKERLLREAALNLRMLQDRDRQFAALKAECAALQGDWAWRAIRSTRRGLSRMRGLLLPARDAGRAGAAAG